MRGREDSPKKKMNQRLFKRLILYYNVSIRKTQGWQNIHKSRQRSIRGHPDDSRRAVDRTTRRIFAERRWVFGGVPFQRG